jgi:hypothetical protein
LWLPSHAPVLARARQHESKPFSEPCKPCFCDPHGAAIALARNPSEFETTTGEGRTKAAGDVRSAFTPIQAGTTKCAPAAGGWLGTELPQENNATVGDFSAIGAKGHVVAVL